MKILTDSGIGMPPYLKWGRTHSVVSSVFFNVQLSGSSAENHPEQFEQAMKYEKISDDPGKTLHGFRECL